MKHITFIGFWLACAGLGASALHAQSRSSSPSGVQQKHDKDLMLRQMSLIETDSSSFSPEEFEVEAYVKQGQLSEPNGISRKKSASTKRDSAEKAAILRGILIQRHNEERKDLLNPKMK